MPYKYTFSCRSMSPDSLVSNRWLVISQNPSFFRGGSGGGVNLSWKKRLRRGGRGNFKNFPWIAKSSYITETIYLSNSTSPSPKPNVKVISSMPFDFLYHVDRENDLKTERLGANLFWKRREKQSFSNGTEYAWTWFQSLSCFGLARTFWYFFKI